MRSKNNNKKEHKNQLMIFEDHEVEIFEFDGDILFNPYHVGACLELGESAVRKAIGNMTEKQVIKLKNSDVKESNIRKLNNAGENFLTESGVYKLVFRSNKPNAEEFTDWIADEVLPTIRKTGGYVNDDALFINTYLPFADDNTKLLFSTTLETVRRQNELIQKQKNEILHKQEVINGLTDDIDIYKKRVIINRICKRRAGNYANRYKELYKCFRETFHIDLEARCEGYNLKQVKRKDKLTTIAYAEKFGHIDDLYTCCVKLYESEVREILKELDELHK